MLLGCTFVLRDIELAASLMKDITLDMVGMIVHWRLSASKSDPSARGCTISWGCTCSQRRKLICPFHLMLEILKDAPDYIRSSAMPLLGDAEGNPTRKRNMILTMRRLQAITGEDNVDIKGHSMRVA